MLKKCSRNEFGLLPNYIVKTKKYIVLKPCNCIARERARKIVLEEKGVQWAGLYCNIEVCRKKKICIAIHLCVL